MNAKIWGIIGGVTLILALLSPLVLGSSKKVEQLFKVAEELQERSDWEGAIKKYIEALEESKKLGVKTEQIDQEFTTLTYLKISQCYYELGEKTSDVKYYRTAITHIKKVVLDTQVTKHQEELFYLWAENLYKIGELNQSESKFLWLIERFPNSRWIEKAWYTIGHINRQNNNYDKALDAFGKLVDESSNSRTVEEAQYIIGNINYRKKNYEEALRSFQNLLEQFPDSEYKEEAEYRIDEVTWLIVNHEAEEMYKSACVLKQQGKVHDAYQFYTNLITQFPDSRYYVTEAYIGKAEIHLEAEDYMNARLNYDEAIHNTDDTERKIELYEAYHYTYLVPDYPEPVPSDPSGELFVEARLLRSEKRFLEAAKIYEQLANSTLPAEDTAYVLYWEGRCYQKAALTDSTLFRNSVNAFKKLIIDHEDNSYNIKAYYHLTLAYTDWAKVSGDQHKCQSVIDIVEKANTKYADKNEPKYKGFLSLMEELRERAILKLHPNPVPDPDPKDDPVTDLDPKPIPEPEPEYIKLIKQAQRLLRLGELKAAAKKGKQARYLNPNYEPAQELLSEIKEKHYGHGWTFFDEEEYDKAIAAFKNAINIDQKFKEAHNHLAVVYIKQEKYIEAIKTLEEAIKSDEKFKEAHFNLALAYLELGESEKAVKAANIALRIDPNYNNARMLIDFIAD